jgi:acyl-CoA hydrolase
MSRLDMRAAVRAFRQGLPDRARIFVGGCSGEPIGLAAALRADPALAAGLIFCGQWVPGINQTDWAGLHPDAQAETTFLAPFLRASFEAGRTRILPMAYSQSWDWLASTSLDGAVVMVSPPDANGDVSLGLSADFAPVVLARRDVPAFALINPQMPAVPNSVRVPLERFAILAEEDRSLIEVAPQRLAPGFERIAAQVAGLIPEGAALQFGIGNVQQAALTAIAGLKGVSIHSGMISDPVMGFLDTDDDLQVVTGVAVGTRPLYERLTADRRVHFRPVSETHFHARLAAIPRFVAVNSVLEVDLFGQANAEFLRGRQVSGTGGLTDFLRGARASEGGIGITALLSTAQDGQISRIVARLAPDATSVTRADMDTVVTEHGAARLIGLDLDARAAALIGIADPAHRSALANAWDEMRRGM